MPITRTDAPFNSRRFFIWLVASLLFSIASVIGYNQQPTHDPFAPALSWSNPAWWKQPMEDNAFRRLPAVNSTLTSVRFADDGLHGWAVGIGRTILATRDGGVHWEPQNGVSNAWLTSVHFLADGQRGWVVGSGGTILATRDGGAQWEPQSSGSEKVLGSVHFLADGQRGWVVGSGGTILATRDGGANWEPQSSGSETVLTSVHFLADGQHGWVVGSGGTILATRDGGAHWEPQSSGSKKVLESLHFLADGLHGWAAGREGTILVTRDGGSKWESQSSGSETWLKSVHFLADGLHGWAVGNDGTILATRDGGAQWVPQSSGSDVDLSSAHFLADGLHGWAVGDYGAIFATRDGGAQWVPQSSGDLESLYEAYFLADGQHGWAVGKYGTILVTRDGGSKWEPQSSGSKTPLWSVQFLADGQRGWAVGKYGTILATRDGGSKWEPQSSGSKAGLSFVHFLADGQHGWAVGSEGTILATGDGGGKWVPQSSGSKAILASVHFLADGLHGWAVGNDGTILATRDGGSKWEPQSSGSKAGLSSMHFLADGQRGWAVGDDGTLLATRDGGDKWEPQSSDNEAHLTSVHFLADGQRGWAVGDDGTLLATRDGGDKWVSQSSGRDTFFNSVNFSADGRIGFIVGNGVILRSNDGGATWQMPQYHRGLAPWFYAAWLGILLLTVIALLVERKIRREITVADLLVSDEPVTNPENDRLGHRELVGALSAFLRNRRTLPPLSVAIVAPWGKGKSSVMRMLTQSLESNGIRPVWFNAWHHQREEIVLAALLENIRVQALPFWLSPWGMVFRIALLGQRMVRHYVITTLVMIVALFGAFVLFEHGDKLPLALQTIEWKPLLQLEWDEFIDGLYNTVNNLPQLIHVVVALIALLGAAAFTLLYGFRAFPEHPAVLFATLSEKFKTRQAEAQTAFRYKFARHFGDVCKALRPRTLTVFIDDLDRCSPEKALETLEAVNYLVSSGACYVVLGMDKKVVESLVGLACEKLASEMTAEAAVPNGSADGDKSNSGSEVERRRTYARQYLEKLVNFELPVPATEPGSYHRLSSGEREWKLLGMYEAIPDMLRAYFLMPFVFVVSFVAAIYFVKWVPAPLQTPPKQSASQEAEVSAIPSAKDAPIPLVNKAVPATEEQRQEGGGGFVQADPINDYDPVIAMFFFIVIFMVFFLRRTRGEYVVDDSPAFHKALEIWLPLAISLRTSPRQAKRFINQTRFLAMRSRTEMQAGWREKLVFVEAFIPGALKRWDKYSDKYKGISPAEKLRKLNKLKDRAIRRWSAQTKTLPPEMVVALAAIRCIFSEAINLDSLESLKEAAVWDTFFDKDQQDKTVAIFNFAWTAHKKRFPDSPWPPTPEQMDLFRKWMDGIKQN